MLPTAVAISPLSSRRFASQPGSFQDYLVRPDASCQTSAAIAHSIAIRLRSDGENNQFLPPAPRSFGFRRVGTATTAMFFAADATILGTCLP